MAPEAQGAELWAGVEEEEAGHNRSRSTMAQALLEAEEARRPLWGRGHNRNKPVPELRLAVYQLSPRVTEILEGRLRG